MKKLTIADAIVLHLADNRGQWILGATLEKSTFHGRYTGVSGMRSMRSVASLGFHEVDRVKYFVEKKEEKGLVYYRVTGGESTKTEQVVEYLPNGSVKIMYVCK